MLTPATKILMLTNIPEHGNIFYTVLSLDGPNGIR